MSLGIAVRRPKYHPRNEEEKERLEKHPLVG